MRTPDVIVIGGSLAGLATAMFYAEQGRTVRVLEQDAADGPTSVRDAIASPPHRRSTPQDHHSHVLLARGQRLLAERAPAVLDALSAAGAVQHHIEGAPELVGVLCRRPVLDWVMRHHVRELPGIEFVDGRVRGLYVDRKRRRVLGVHTDNGTSAAGLVIDAAGRRSAVRGWLSDAGVAMPQPLRHPCGVVYLTVYYRLERWPASPLNRGFGAGGFGRACACVVFPSDNGSMSVTIGLPAGDGILRRLRTHRAFTAAVQLHPFVAPWIDPDLATPLTGVAEMSGLHNQFLPPPEIDGIVAVGDAACTTNPAYGRGMTLALLHAAAVADAIEPGGEDTASIATDIMDRELRPWFDDSVAQDRVRTARWSDQPVPDEPLAFAVDRAMRAASIDSDARRDFIRWFNLIDPPDAIVRRWPAPSDQATEPVWTPGPTRSELIDAIKMPADTALAHL